MAAKGKKQLQEDIDSQEAWDALLDKEGLKVIDVYSTWCGPCKALVSLFRKKKTDTGDPLLNFFTANSDKVASLESYRGKSEPLFLLYGKNVLVDKIHGANGPLLEAVITEQLQREHDAVENNAERIPYDDANADKHRIPSARPKSAKKAEPVKRASSAKPKDFSFAMIKPDVAGDADAVDDIFAKIAEAGLHAVKQDEVTLDKERASAFYAEHKGKSFFDTLIEFMTSGSVRPIILSGHDTVKKWRTLIGPTNSEKAKAEAPGSIRALYGSSGTQNAVHGSDAPTSAHREIEFFFPDWAAENLPSEEAVVVTKADTLSGVEDMLKSAKIEVSQKLAVEVDGEKAAKIAHGNADLAAKITGSLVALTVSRIGCISALNSLRAHEQAHNIVYRSATSEDVAKDLDNWFPNFPDTAVAVAAAEPTAAAPAAAAADAPAAPAAEAPAAEAPVEAAPPASEAAPAEPEAAAPTS